MGKPASHYRQHRDQLGLTPRQSVDMRRAELLAMELAVKRGELVERAVVDAAAAREAEVLRGDLFALPAALAGKLANKKFSHAKVRAIVDAALRDMVQRWVDANLTTKDAMQ